LIILICGYPRVGKTIIAHELTPLFNAVVLFTDKIRKEFIDNPHYGDKEKRTIYKIFILIAKYLHNARVNCILGLKFGNKQIIHYHLDLRKITILKK